MAKNSLDEHLAFLQLYIAIGVPTLTILIALIVNMVQVSRIRRELHESMREIHQLAQETRRK